MNKYRKIKECSEVEYCNYYKTLSTNKLCKIIVIYQ